MTKSDNLYCSCGGHIIKSLSNNDLQIKNRTILVKNNVLYAICKSCCKEVALPLELNLTVNNPKLYIKK